MIHIAWDHSDLVAEAWISVYPALEGALAKLCVCLCASVGECVRGHEAVGMLRWQMALLHCRATLANRGEDREKVGKKEEKGCERDG